MTLLEIRRSASLLALAALLTGCGSTPSKSERSGSAYWNPPALADHEGELPDGREVIQRMVEFMSSHNALAAEAQLTYEAVQPDGQKLHFDLLHRIAIKRDENKLLWHTLRDDGTYDQGWIASGRFTMVKQPANIYAQLDGPLDIAEMVSMLGEEYGIDVPFEDMISGQAAERWLGQEVGSVSYIGEAFIGTRWTDQIAIRRPGIDLEIWVAKGEAPYPARIAAVFTEVAGAPSYVMDFREYTTDQISRDAVELKIPDDAQRVEIAPVVVF